MAVMWWTPWSSMGGLDHEAVAHRVLGHHARLDELREVARTAGLGPRPGQPVAPERLAADHRARDRAVDVEVADRRAVDDVVDGVRVAGEQPAGEAEGRGVHPIARLLDVADAL